MGKRGPKPKGPATYEGKSRTLSTRITAELRAQLDVVCKARGSSLSSEIEHRLRRSFTEDGQIAERFGSHRVYALMRLIAAAVNMTEDPLVAQTWLDDPYLYDQAARAVTRVLEVFRPEGSVAPPRNGPQLTDAELLVRGIPSNIKGADATAWPRSWHEDLMSRSYEAAAVRQGRLNAERVMEEVRSAAPSLPLPSSGATDEQRHRAVIRDLLSDLARRIPETGLETGKDEVESTVKDLISRIVRLRDKAWKNRQKGRRGRAQRSKEGRPR